MKKLISLFIMFALAASVCSCRKDVPAEIVLGTASVDCGAEACEKVIGFTTNYDWTAFSTVQWASLSRTSGEAGDVSIVVSIAEPDVNERSGMVIISCLDIRDTIRITQKQLDKMVISRHEVLLTNAGGTFDVTVGANIPFSVNIPVDCGWLKLNNSTKTYAEEAVSFICEANSSYDARVATVLFASSDGKFSDTLTVTQSQFDKVMLKERNVSVGSAGGTFPVVVSTNMKFKAAVQSEVSWLRLVSTKGLVDETVNFQCDSNPTYDDRTAHVFFTSEDGVMYDTLVVTQSRLDRLSLLTDRLDFTSDGGKSVVEVESNVGYEMVIPESAPWISFVDESTKGLVKGAFTIACESNGSYDDRSAEVIFRSLDGKLADTLTVFQIQKDGLFASPDSVSLQSGGGTFTVELKHNVKYEVSSDCDWLSWEETPRTKGLEIRQYLFKASEYAGTSQPRSAVVTFTNGSLKATVSVVQNAVRPDVLVFGTASTRLTAPELEGAEGFYGSTDWGDGSVEDYTSGMSHEYKDSAAAHEVSISSHYSRTVTFNTVEGLNFVDFSSF